MKVLDEHVIGQRAAKKHLAVAISNHCKCINDPTGSIRRRNIMMVGPTESGKTLLAKTLANYLDVPMVIVNAPDYTQNGYIGGNVDSILVQLLAAANYNTKVAQKGIIFFDEIDKIARKSATLSSSRDPAGEGVQQALLKMIEGAPVHLSVQNNGSVESFDFDTSKVLCICAGAFEGIKDEKRKKKQSAIGFHTDDMTSAKETTAITQDDLINFGILPELLGRTPVLVELDELTEDDLVRILTEPKNSIVKSYQALFRAGGSELAFAPETLQQIARSAIRKKTGARGLESILENIFIPFNSYSRNPSQRPNKKLLTPVAPAKRL